VTLLVEPPDPRAPGTQSLQTSVTVQTKLYYFLSPILSTGTIQWCWAIQGSVLGRCKRSYSSPRYPDWTWGWSSFLFKRYQEFFPLEQSIHGVKMITYPHLMLRLRMHGAVPLLPQYVLTA